MEILVEHAGAGAGEEETTGAAAVAWTPPITSPHVLLKSHHRRGVDGDEAGFSELRVSHGDERPTQVYVLVVEGQRLTDAQAGGRQQSQQRGVGRAQEAISDLTRLGQQRVDFVVAVDVWNLAQATSGEQVGRRDFRAGIVGLVIPGEATTSGGGA